MRKEGPWCDAASHKTNRKLPRIGNCNSIECMCVHVTLCESRDTARTRWPLLCNLYDPITRGSVHSSKRRTPS
jgi:hypothetical protein